ncbi:hypothetical protein EVAR_11852_1 [Eumeta japonica]|uniref:Uncharacterized protein n=1 Tax=Eumeta variegata TaxID=151549 RepID=A0A4C1U893_EUMVA|nr:hypothetical protein EVAR_11852_1 [Eumeta japonica]
MGTKCASLEARYSTGNRLTHAHASPQARTPTADLQLRRGNPQGAKPIRTCLRLLFHVDLKIQTRKDFPCSVHRLCDVSDSETVRPVEETANVSPTVYSLTAPIGLQVIKQDPAILEVRAGFAEAAESDTGAAAAAGAGGPRTSSGEYSDLGPHSSPSLHSTTPLRSHRLIPPPSAHSPPIGYLASTPEAGKALMTSL